MTAIDFRIADPSASFSRIFLEFSTRFLFLSAFSDRANNVEQRSSLLVPDSGRRLSAVADYQRASWARVGFGGTGANPGYCMIPQDAAGYRRMQQETAGNGGYCRTPQDASGFRR